MVKFRVLGLFLAVFVLSIFFNSVAGASDSCPTFPKVIWWETSHQKIISYVSRKHNGDWAPYLKKWDYQLNKMKNLQEKGGTAVFKSKGLRLQGEMLQQYVEAIKERLSVTKCLAQSEMANAGIKKSSSANDG
jgi:hypothetical protein